jgi:uncharacterized protein YdbL (DUF1318 family)
MKPLHLFWMTFLLSACVTINIYFPAAAAEKAADRIIQDIYGETGGEKPAEPAGQEPGARREARPAGLALLEWLVAPAQAGSADLNVSSPAIDRLRAAMKARHGRLEPYYNSGAVGLTADGLLTIRDPRALALKDRNRVRKLVADENNDRNALYREIAAANGHPEWEGDIRATFARRWVANAKGGWWYQAGGGWKQK